MAIVSKICPPDEDSWLESELENYPCKICRKIARCVARIDQPEIYLGTTSELTDYSCCQDHKEFIESALKPKWLLTDMIWSICTGRGGVHIDYAGYSNAVVHELEIPSTSDLIPIRGSCREAESAIGRDLNEHWIDLDIVRGWRDVCACEHNQKCSSPAFNLPALELPWLIDTYSRCLVPGFSGACYVTLSYVWGAGDRVSTTKTSLPLFQQEGAFADGAANELPQAIRDAIGLVERLQERYLWIDSLCIVQDDKENRGRLIQNMASIYHNATLTIIAADGHDVTWGLRGIPDISQPRQVKQVHGPGGSRFLVKPQGTISESIWNTRGWTFQEYIFSRRRLIFIDGTVRWECGQAKWREELLPDSSLPDGDFMEDYDNDHSSIRTAHLFHPPSGHPTQVAAKLMRDADAPDLEQFTALVKAYNIRDLTFDSDSLPAFQGVLAALDPFFKHGFISGLPVAALDAALVWTPSHPGQWLRPRWTYRNTSASANEAFPPSWTWAAWAGEIWYHPNLQNWDQTIPLLNWYEWTGHDGDFPLPIAHQNEWFSGDRLFWSSLHHDVPSQEPPCFDSLDPNHGEHNSGRWDHETRGRYLCARTQQAFVDTGICCSAVPGRESWYRVLPSGDRLTMYDRRALSDESKKYHIVVISASGSTGEEYRDSAQFDGYNVLCVEWVDGIAYRQGSGRVPRAHWEALDWEWVDLVLG